MLLGQLWGYTEVMRIRTPFLRLIASMLLGGLGYTEASHQPGRHRCSYMAACVSGTFSKVKHARRGWTAPVRCDQCSSHSEI